MAQQTAVEWLMELWENQEPFERFILPEQFEQAKEMEKQQIMKANVDGFNECANYEEKTSEQYYNETYENNK